MTIDYRILTCSNDDNKLVSLVQKTFQEVNTIYNKWNPESEIARFNQSRSIEPQILSKELKKLLDLTDRVVKLSEGRFDPTIEPLADLWKDRIPSEETLTAIKPAIGWHNIHYDETTLSKSHPLTELDLGGIAKGYTVDLLFTRLQKEGFDPLYVEWGGEIRVSKSHPSGRAWQIMIYHPEDSLQAIKLNLTSKAIATSGDYAQNWLIQDQRYYHIIDPCTLSPLKIKPGSICSATLITDECWLADGLATAACFFNSKFEVELWIDRLKKEVAELQCYTQENSK